MTVAAKPKLEALSNRDPFDFPPLTKTYRYQGVDYTFRELTVAETDEAREGSMIDDKFDGRLMSRLMVCKAAVSPVMDLEQLSKLPQRLYSKVIDIVNDLNDPEALTDKDEDENPGKS